MIKLKQLFVIIFLSILILGCGGKGSSVTGMVRFGDGTPLTAGTVLFESGQHSFSGNIRNDGTFQMTGDSVKSGLPDGTYAVAVVRAIETSTDSDGNPTARDLIDTKFAQTKTSELTCTVKGKTIFDIKVTKP
ncbi:MAG: hypothetical protein LBL62_09815 [Planctomycetaceae bacterium]|jgi:hypothetical protein|nr:hypothetical protein [Planctomycetaceae bacterium]